VSFGSGYIETTIYSFKLEQLPGPLSRGISTTYPVSFLLQQ